MTSDTDDRARLWVVGAAAVAGLWVWSINAHAAPDQGGYNIYGAGQKSCGVWTETYNQQGSAPGKLADWVLGYLTAYNAYGPGPSHIIKGTDEKGPWHGLPHTAHSIRLIISIWPRRGWSWSLTRGRPSETGSGGKPARIDGLLPNPSTGTRGVQSFVLPMASARRVHGACGKLFDQLKNIKTALALMRLRRF
jgi:hypothetical protein